MVGKLSQAWGPWMRRAAASYARAASSSVSYEPSQMRLLLESRISHTNRPHLRRRTPLYSSALARRTRKQARLRDILLRPARPPPPCDPASPPCLRAPGGDPAEPRRAPRGGSQCELALTSAEAPGLRPRHERGNCAESARGRVPVPLGPGSSELELLNSPL